MFRIFFVGIQCSVVGMWKGTYIYIHFQGNKGAKLNRKHFPKQYLWEVDFAYRFTILNER